MVGGAERELRLGETMVDLVFVIGVNWDVVPIVMSVV